VYARNMYPPVCAKNMYPPVCARNMYVPVPAGNTYINVCMHASARSMCIPVGNRCNAYVPVSTECLTRCCECTCVVVRNSNGNNGSFILEDVDKEKTSNTLSFFLLSAFVLLAIQVSKSKYRPSF
jgi:hypothetical protein